MISLDKNADGEITKNHTRYIVGDIVDTILEEKYDIIFNLSVLEHIDNWETALKNMDAMLKIRGRLVMTPAFFSSNRQFSLHQIPELLSQLKNYDFGVVDLSLDDTWCSDYVKNNYLSIFADKRLLEEQEYNSIELYIDEIKIQEKKDTQTNFKMDIPNPRAL